MRLSFLPTLQRETEDIGGGVDWYLEYKNQESKVAALENIIRKLQESITDKNGDIMDLKLKLEGKEQKFRAPTTVNKDLSFVSNIPSPTILEGDWKKEAEMFYPSWVSNVNGNKQQNIKYDSDQQLRREGFIQARQMSSNGVHIELTEGQAQELARNAYPDDMLSEPAFTSVAEINALRHGYKTALMARSIELPQTDNKLKELIERVNKMKPLIPIKVITDLATELLNKS